MLVIGAGAAGLFAAIAALERGAKVTILERNEKAGKKIYISGKGRCNLTNFAEKQDFFLNVPTNGKFLYSAVNFFDSVKVRAFFEQNGVPLKIERGGRVFPVSDKASDVTAALVKRINALGGRIIYNARVTKIVKTDGVFEVTASCGVYKDTQVVIATGGVSYPSTGSDGDGYGFASSLGHTIIQPKPALSAIEADTPVSLAGLTLKNVALKCIYNNKIIYKDFGEALFTHNGLSGPIILSASSVINKYPIEAFILELDLKPALDSEKLDARVLRDFEQNHNKTISNTLPELMPTSLIPVVLQKANIDPSLRVNSITKRQRQALISVVKGLRFNAKRFAPISQAIVTSGGVNVKEVNPKTMESKLTDGLYFAGEVLDYDCFTGGFNLQAAFSCGYTAGAYAAEQNVKKDK